MELLRVIGFDLSLGSLNIIIYATLSIREAVVIKQWMLYKRSCRFHCCSRLTWIVNPQALNVVTDSLGPSGQLKVATYTFGFYWLIEPWVGGRLYQYIYFLLVSIKLNRYTHFGIQALETPRCLACKYATLYIVVLLCTVKDSVQEDGRNRRYAEIWQPTPSGLFMILRNAGRIKISDNLGSFLALAKSRRKRNSLM